ncbi:response regulator [Aquiflexum sp. LQ15W]|uniref:Hpt domain-containing response regulator n=1 Tax=Cognataquiflexum nitidum TaxID=2922272 RepID=UPI001F13E6D1|nr:hybrid sensor histidine kinase/response regulator [Cognataquiflexum nitidum]MCH6199565.1 response regulator [Cognataquiflexum nitidum]
MKPKKVLIVDDNSLNRKVFEHIIGQLYQYGTASDGREALDKIRTGEFDIVLMDIQMPILDGINTLNIVKNEKIADIPVIAVSAYASENDRDYFISAGFDDFIPKPIKPRNLLETLDKHLQKSKNIQKTEDSTTPELDIKVVNTLLKFNNAENIRLVYEEFIEESINLLSEIKTLVAKGNYSEIGEKIHIIKGNSGTLGAMKIYNFCQNFEKNIKSLNFENTLEDYIYLENIVQSFRLKITSSQLLNP